MDHLKGCMIYPSIREEEPVLPLYNTYQMEVFDRYRHFVKRHRLETQLLREDRYAERGPMASN
jgi:hypothetical protein